jgi:hypothetical protein
MYSEQGLLEFMRPEFFTGFHRLMVVSYCIPGSPQMCAAPAISSSTPLPESVSTASPVVTAFVCQGLSSRAARMKSSVTRTE